MSIFEEERVPSMRSEFRRIAWLSGLSAVAAGLISLRFLTGGAAFGALQHVYVFFAAAGLAFIVLWLLFALLAPATRRWPKAGGVASWLILSGFFIALAADTFVFQQYRFHINWPMIDLAINAGSDIFAFSTAMLAKIAGLAGLAAAFCAALVWIAGKLSRVRGALGLSLALLFGYLAVNLVHAYAFAQAYKPVTVLTERIPLYRPIRANSFFAKFGLVVKEDKVDLASSASGTFNYPLAPLRFAEEGRLKTADGKPLNVLFLAVDSLRADMYDPKIMPNLYRIGQENIAFLDHYSSGNATRAGVFGLFYGVPPLYWHDALATGRPAAMITGLQEQGYAIGTFTTASLYRPEFYATIFSTVRPLRMNTEGPDVTARDRIASEDFIAFAKAQHAKGQPFFGFLFYDSVHAYAFPKDMKTPFPNYWKEVDNTELGPDFDPTPYFNRYKNAAYYVDQLIGKVFDDLKAAGLLENTVVFVTSDHGEEFNDGKLNYWGHNGNFSAAQIQIPLVVHWPGMPAQAVSHRTTAYDVSATVMTKILGATNPVGDFSVGTDLFSEKPRDPFVSSSYLEDAVIAGEEALLIKATGWMEAHALKGWADLADDEVKKYVPDYLRIRGQYLQ